MLELCFSQSARGGLRCAQHCGGGGRKVFGVIVGRDDGRPATRKEIRQAQKQAQRKREALDRAGKSGRVRVLAHDNSPETAAFLRAGLLDFVIDQDLTYQFIDTIQARGYVTLDRVSEKSRTKVFRPTDQGTLTTEKLDEFFSSIINVKYTAEMESELDHIADGNAKELDILTDFWQKFEPLLDKAYEGMEKVQPEKVGELCPECGGELVYRNGRFGKFISCSNFPTCRYTRQIEKEKEKPEPTGRFCPDCGSELVKRKNRFGSYFIGCSNYPKCHYMENLNGERVYSKADKKAMEKKEEGTTKKTTRKKSTAKKTTTKKKTTTRKKKAVEESAE